MPIGSHVHVTSSGLTEISSGFNRAEKAVQGFGKSGSRAVALLSKDIGGIKSQFSGLVAAIGGVGIGAAGKSILDFNRNLAQLKADAGMSESEIQALKSRIEGLSGTSGIFASDISGAYRIFMDFGGQMDLAKDIMSDLTMFSKATGTEMSSAANIAATLGGNLKMGKEEIIIALSTMNQLGIAGQMALKDVAGNLPQLLAAGQSKGFTGMRGVSQLGAAHQIIAKSYGTGPEASNMARTALDALMRDLVAKEKDLKKSGISIFDKNRNMRDLDVLMKEILAKTKGDASKLAKIFTSDSQKAAAAFSSEKDKSKLGSDVIKMFSVTGTRENLEKAFKDVTTGIGEAAHKFDLASAKMGVALQEHGAKLVGFVGENPYKSAALLGGGYLGLKIIAPLFTKMLSSAIGGKTGSASDIGSALGGGGIGIPVKVTNWPSGLGGGSSIGPSGSREIDLLSQVGPTAAGPGKLATAAKIGGQFLAAGAIGYGIGSIIDHYTGASDKLSTWAVGGQREESKKRSASYESEAKLRSLVEQAKTLGGLASRGITSAEVSGIGKVSLSDKNILKLIAAKGTEQGLSKEQLAPLLQQIVNLLRDQKITVKTGSGSGLDRPHVIASRGKL